MTHHITRQSAPDSRLRTRLEEKMSTPTDDSEFLHDLELDVRTELTLAETGQPQQAADGAPAAEELPDPDAERYEVSLRTLLGAVEAVADRSHPGDHPARG